MKLLDVLVITGIVLAKPIVVGYFMPNTRSSIQDIPYDKLTHINFAFGTLSNETHPSQISLEHGYRDQIHEIVKSAHSRKGTRPKILLSLGGWGGSRMFSKMAKEKNYRTDLINQIIKFMAPASEGGLGLDGIDIDWEFPGRMTNDNHFDAADTGNYLSLLKELKAEMGRKFRRGKLITAAVRVEPFDGEDGSPLANVSEFAEYFDFVTIMAYDVYSYWSETTGPSAPLHHHENVGLALSLKQALTSWKQAGFPSSKIVGGLAFYGQTFAAAEHVSETSQFVKKQTVDDQPKGYSTSVPVKGDYSYRDMRENVLADPTTPKGGYIRYFDNVTQTPYLFEPSQRSFISYDDPISIQAKANYIQAHGFGGVMIWELSKDYKFELIDAAHSGLKGLPAHNKSPRRKPKKHSSPKTAKKHQLRKYGNSPRSYKCQSTRKY